MQRERLRDALLGAPWDGQRPGATGVMQNRNMSLRDRIVDLIAGGARATGASPTMANRMRNEAGTVVDFVPGAGDAVGLDDAVRDYQTRNYGKAATGAALTALGLIPGAGDWLRKGADELMQRAAKRGVALELMPSQGRLIVSKIVVPKASRGQGVGSSVLKEITDFADTNDVPLSLTPSTDFGASSKSALERFYGRHGFEPNIGRKRDFEISEAMRRYPRKTP